MLRLFIANKIYFNMIKITDDGLIKSASYASVITAIIIMLIKSYGWLATESQSMLASLVDSMLDITSSLINLIAVRIVLLPPDNNHRFGHDKFQDLAIFSQSIFFFASCLFTLFSSTKALYLQGKPGNHELGVSSMLLCTALAVILVIYQTYVIKKTHSKIIAIDKLHYFSDFLANLAVIASLYLSARFWYIDSLTGIVISLYIIRASYFLFKDAIKNLSDEEFADGEREQIIEIIKSYSEVKGFHELKTRSAGNKPFIQFHLEMDGGLSLKRAHIISDKVYDKILEVFPNAEIIIHQDPCKDE